MRGECLGGRGGRVGGLSGCGGGGGKNERRNLLGDVCSGGRCFLVGEDRYGNVVVREEDVFSHEATNFAGVLDGSVALVVEDVDAEAVVRIFTVGEGERRLHLLVAGRS